MADATCGCACGVCQDGYHIFCDRFPHGTEEEAERWFAEHPEAARQVQPLGDRGKAALSNALKKIQEKAMTTKDVVIEGLSPFSAETQQRITFKLGDEDFIVLTPGKVIVRGEEIADNRQVYERMCEWLDRAGGARRP